VQAAGCLSAITGLARHVYDKQQCVAPAHTTPVRRRRRRRRRRGLLLQRSVDDCRLRQRMHSRALSLSLSLVDISPRDFLPWVQKSPRLTVIRLTISNAMAQVRRRCCQGRSGSGRPGACDIWDRGRWLVGPALPHFAWSLCCAAPVVHVRVRVEILRSQNCRIVGGSQPVLQ
jgi:hypothetical protein